MSYSQMFKLNPLTEIEVNQMLESAKDHSRKRYAIVLILRDTGVRASEFCRLSSKSIIESEAMTKLRVHGKKRPKEKRRPVRYVPLTKRAKIELLWLLENFGKEGDDDSTIRSLTFHRNTIYKHVVGAAEDAGLKDDGERTISPHVLRHTFGVETAHAKIPSAAIRSAMGHKSLAAAERYQRWDEARVDDAFGEFVSERSGEEED